MASGFDSTSPRPVSNPGIGTAAACALLFFLSGSVLVIEILAARLLAPLVGLSLETYTSIIGVVLAGIAVGHAVGGRLADKYPWSALLGPCVGIGGLLAFAIVPAVALLGGGLQHPSLADVVVLTFGAFFLPTAVISATEPMIAKARLTDLAEAGQVVGSLSAVATAGALAGTFLTGFVLVGAAPTSRILYAVGTVLVVLGVVLSVRRRKLAAGSALVVVLSLLAASDAVPVLCRWETKYYCVQIRSSKANPEARLLQLDRIFHSYVNPEDPSDLGFRYQRAAAAVLAALPAKRPTVIHVGGGGFAFPRFVAATVPGSSNKVLELDPGLAEVAAERLGLDRDAVTVEDGDGRAGLRRQAKRSADLIVMDAFGSLEPPWHLATVEVVRTAREVLRPEGAYVVNAVDSGGKRFTRSVIRTLETVFPHVVVVEPPHPSEDPSNTLVIGSMSPLELRLPTSDGRLLTGDEVARFTAGAAVLTDDFAPVEQLVTQPHH